MKGYYALCFKTYACVSKHASFGAHHVNLNEDRPILSATKMYSSMTLDSGNIRLMRIFARGLPGEGASNNSGVIENVDFLGFRTLNLRNCRK